MRDREFHLAVMMMDVREKVLIGSVPFWYLHSRLILEVCDVLLHLNDEGQVELGNLVLNLPNPLLFPLLLKRWVVNLSNPWEVLMVMQLVCLRLVWMEKLLPTLGYPLFLNPLDRIHLKYRV